MLIRFFIEITLETLISAFIQFKMSDMTIPADVFSLITAIIFLGAVVGLGLGSVPFLIINRTRLHDKNMHSRFGELYEGINTSFISKAVYPSLFFVRRFIFTALIFFVDEHYQWVQVMVFMQVNIFIILYLGAVRPFKESKLFKLEFLNEVTLSLASICVLGFTEAVSDKGMRTGMGWGYMAIMSGNFLINIGVSAFELVQKVRSCISGIRTRKKRIVNMDQMSLEIFQSSQPQLMLRNLEIIEENIEGENSTQNQQKAVTLRNIPSKGLSRVEQERTMKRNRKTDLMLIKCDNMLGVQGKVDEGVIGGFNDQSSQLSREVSPPQLDLLFSQNLNSEMLKLQIQNSQCSQMKTEFNSPERRELMVSQNPEGGLSKIQMFFGTKNAQEYNFKSASKNATDKECIAFDEDEFDGIEEVNY